MFTVTTTAGSCADVYLAGAIQLSLQNRVAAQRADELVALGHRYEEWGDHERAEMIWTGVDELIAEMQQRLTAINDLFELSQL